MTSPATPTDSSPRPPVAEASTSLGTSAASGGSRSLPDWCPAWAERLGDSYLSGTSCVFLMHGNVRDLVPVAAPNANGQAADAAAWGTVSDFLAREMFGRWDIVLAYDVGKGLRPLAGPDRRGVYAKAGPDFFDVVGFSDQLEAWRGARQANGR